MPIDTVPGSMSPATGGELLAQFRAEIDALPEADVLTPRVDVAAAASTAIGSMPEVESHRAELVAIFGARASATLDRLVPISRALLAAQAAHEAVADHDLEAQANAIRAIRDRLSDAATALIERGLVDRKTLDRLTGGGGYQALFTDTLALVSWFEVHAGAIASRSKVTTDELRSAYHSAEAFATEIARRDQARSGTSETGRDRQRVFTLFFRTYENVGKMISYLRWQHGDADQIAPSIYSRSRPRRDAISTPPVTAATPTPVSPGMPGGSPFQG
jgi:hypothetical protein